MNGPRVLSLILLAFLVVPSVSAGANSCVECHSAQVPSSIRHLQSEWQGSVHARSGITCEYCHGGDPGKGVKKQAHRGVYGPLNPKSTIYYTRIPALCGGCHPSEYDAFSMSRHYRDFMSRGSGPNCVTCHDSMSTKIIKADQIETFCALCHNAKAGLLPEVTSRARIIMEKMERLAGRIREAREAADRAGDGEKGRARARGFLSLAQKELSACKHDWHAFRLNRVAARLERVEELVRKGRDALDRS